MPAITLPTLNREGWLTALAKATEPLFRGYRFAPYRVTCGWPCQSALSAGRRRYGECHSLRTSADGHHEIFITPLVAQSLEVAGILSHELAHVVAGTEAAHGRRFVAVCRHVGLTKGKPTSALPGDRLNDELLRLIESIGPYPHAAIKPILKPKKASTSVTLECECGCRVTISRKWLADVGAPVCGCGGTMEERDA